MAEGEGFALQRLPIGNARGTIACSPDMPRCGIIRGFCPRRINKKGNGCCLFMAEGEGFALQRLPIGNAKGTIACSPGDERSAPGISKTSPSKIKKSPCRFFLWRKARDSNPRILSHQRFSRPPLSTAQPAFRACKLYHKKRLICKLYRKIKEENQKYGAVLYFVHGKRQEETDKYKLSIYCKTIWNKKKN